MTEYACSGRVHHELVAVTNEGRAAAARMFKDLYGAWPETVGEDEIMGGCETCLQAVFADEEFHPDENHEGLFQHHAPHCCERDFSAPTEQSATTETQATAELVEALRSSILREQPMKT